MLELSLTFADGRVARFAEAGAEDAGTFPGEFVQQRRLVARDPAFPDWVAGFGRDVDGGHDEVDLLYGRAVGPQPRHWRTPYVATVTRDGAAVHSITVPDHWSQARPRLWQSSQRPVVRNAAELIRRHWIPNLGTPFGPTWKPAPVTWPGPMRPVPGFVNAMGVAGDNPHLGYVSEWGGHYITTGDLDSLRSVRAECEWLAGNSAFDMLDVDGSMLDVRGRYFVGSGIPNGSNVNDGAGRVGDPLAEDGRAHPAYIDIEIAHAYSALNLGYMLFDDPYYLRAMQNWATWRLLWSVYHRVTQKLDGLMYPGQTRALAWGLRDLGALAISTPTETPKWLRPRAYWESLLDDNFEYALRWINNPSKITTRIPGCWTRLDSLSPWHNAWLAAVIGQFVLQGREKWRRVFDWSIALIVALANGKSGWDRRLPSFNYLLPLRIYDQFLSLDQAVNVDPYAPESMGDLFAYFAAGCPVNGVPRMAPFDPSKWSGRMIQSTTAQTNGSTPQHICSALAVALSLNKPDVQDSYDYVRDGIKEGIADPTRLWAAQARVAIVPLDTFQQPQGDIMATPAQVEAARVALLAKVTADVNEVFGGLNPTDPPPPGAQRILFFRGPESVKVGEPIVVEWDTADASSATLNAASVALRGSSTMTPTAEAPNGIVFELVVNGSAAPVTALVRVVVEPTGVIAPPPPLSVTLTTATNPAQANVPFALTLKVAGNHPTGAVQVNNADTASTLKTVTLAPDGNESAHDVVVALPVGEYQFDALYLGDANNPAKRSARLAVSVRAAGTGEEPPPPPTGTRLSEVTALGWTEIVPVDTRPATPYWIAIDSDFGNSRCMYPFCNSMPWDPIGKRIRMLGNDHTGSPYQHVDYIESENKFVPFAGTNASHGYQHLAVNPSNGDTYAYFFHLRPSGIYKHDGTEFQQFWAAPDRTVEILDEHTADALVWWTGTIVGGGAQGALVLFTGNIGMAHIFDPLTAKCTSLGGVTPDTPGGIYQAVSAYSAKHNCMVYGGGHRYDPDHAVKMLYRLNADGSVTRMPDAPHGVGIFNGMNFVSDSRSGNFVALGKGEHWMLDPTGAGTWTQLPAPATKLDPAANDSFVSSDTPYGVVYIERDKNKPRSTMYLWRS